MTDIGNQSHDGHLMIAGTGRAGTSFLVRWLSALGLDTHISHRGDHTDWDENANAGLETLPLAANGEELPYVIKFPWLYQCIDHILENGHPRIDAVIIPVRDLADAAASRTIVELQSMHAQMPWIDQMDQSWEVWGKTPGGIAYSLNPLDQGRLLAVGFHHLVQRLVQADIPTVFVAFPRLVKDWRHLYVRLKPFLPATATAEAAEAAHRQLYDPTKVRVETKLPSTAQQSQIVQYPSYDDLDATAVRRELLRASRVMAEATEAADRARAAQQTAEALRDAALRETNQWREALNASNIRAGAAEWAAYSERLAAARAAEDAMAASERAATADRQAADAARQAADATRQAADATRQAADATRQAEESAAQATLTNEELRSLRAEYDRVQQEAERLRTDLSAERTAAAHLRQEIDAVYASRSWRMTQPYRTMHMLIRRTVSRPN